MMAGHLFGTKPLFKLMLIYCQLWYYYWISAEQNFTRKIFIWENAIENVKCYISDSLFQSR